MKILKLLGAVAVAASLFACGGGGSGVAINTPPIANAGTNQTTINSAIILDASASDDLDGDNLTYSWKIVEKPTLSNAVLIGDNLEKPSIYLDKLGTYKFELIANDGFENSAPSYVNVYLISAGSSSVGRILPTTQSTPIMVSYISTSNDEKYAAYASAVVTNIHIYATNTGGRTSSNGVLISANILVFRSLVASFLDGVYAKSIDLLPQYYIDYQRIAEEITTYEEGDAAYMLNNVGGSESDVQYIHDLYTAARNRLTN